MVFGLIVLFVLPALCSSCLAPHGYHYGPACSAGAAFTGSHYRKVRYTVTRHSPGSPQLCCEGWACGVERAPSCPGFSWFQIGCTTGHTLTGAPLTWAVQQSQPKVRCYSNPIGATYTVTETHPY